MHSTDDIRAVERLLAVGQSDYAIARVTCVPRATVQRWRRCGFPTRLAPPLAPDDWMPPDEAVYAYLLGLYLGDGHINHRPGRTPVLRITNDTSYAGLIDDAASAMSAVFPDACVRRYVFPESGKTVLHVCDGAVLAAFPQHGPGKKHERDVVLAHWQRRLTHAYPEAFLRGLLHSDGCRSINRVKVPSPDGRVTVYEYPRYYFTNYSGDIRALFREHCELIGVRATQSNFKTISVANRPGVAILDSFVGPKA